MGACQSWRLRLGTHRVRRFGQQHILETFVVIEIVSFEKEPNHDLRTKLFCVFMENDQLLQRAVAGATKIGDRSPEIGLQSPGCRTACLGFS